MIDCLIEMQVKQQTEKDSSFFCLLFCVRGGESSKKVRGKRDDGKARRQNDETTERQAVRRKGKTKEE